jgi:hypothetical protein
MMNLLGICFIAKSGAACEFVPRMNNEWQRFFLNTRMEAISGPDCFQRTLEHRIIAPETLWQPC